MADKYQTIIAGRDTMVSATVTSAGSGDAGKIPGLDASGKLDPSLMPVGVGAANASIVASENLSAGDFVNIYDDAGTPKCRKADSTNDRRADGFVLASVTSPAAASVYFEGQNTQLTGLVAGQRLYLTASGAVSSTPPSSPTDSIHQFLGKALSATVMDVEMADEVVL